MPSHHDHRRGPGAALPVGSASGRATPSLRPDPTGQLRVADRPSSVSRYTGQTRSLVTNVLGRQPGVTPDILKTILEGSGKTAKANITRRTPQITELIEAVERWMVAGEGEGQESRV